MGDVSSEAVIRRTRHTVEARVKELLIAERAQQRAIDRMRADIDFDDPSEVAVETTPGWDGARPEVTVVVSLYNQAQLVVDAIDSVLASAGVGVEVVVVDDHSYDGSFDAVRGLMAARPWAAIALARKLVNEGLGAARNKGFELARAPMVFPLDADNVLYPAGLAKLAAALRDSDAAFSYGIIECFGAGAGLVSYLPWDPERLCESNYIEAMALVRRSVWDEVGGYDTEMDGRFFGWDDYDLWLRIADRGGHGILVPEIVGRYRRGGQSSMASVMNLDVSLPSTYLREKYPLLPWPAP